MKSIVSYLLTVISFCAFAQDEAKNSASYQANEGFTFKLNNGDYQFRIGGFIQPNIMLSQETDGDLERRFNVARSFFMIGGKAVKQKLSFLVQTDFSASNPLMDAWVAYHPFAWLTISGGQKQNFVNTREMLYREDRLQFTDRSLNNRAFNRTGREFGLFVETQFGKKIGIAPKISMTSGDGRNSFGTDSRDVDYGGLKFGGRLDVFPLGFFSEGNDLYTADLMHEESVKILIGSAASRNFGASQAVGEGHGDFFLYNTDGQIQLPNYSKIVADLLMKYKGFSVLLEYTNATASGLDLLFTDESATTILAPTQISQYMILGNGLTGQLGYVTKSGFSFDLRYDQANPEFMQNSNTLLGEFKSYTFGFSKYFNANNLKMQTAFSQVNFAQNRSSLNWSLLVQIGF